MMQTPFGAAAAPTFAGLWRRLAPRCQRSFVALLLALLGLAPAPIERALAQALAPQQAAHLQIDLGDHAGAIRRIAVDTRRNLVATGSDDKTARTWSSGAGELQRVFRLRVGSGEIGRVYGVAPHPLEPWLAVGGSADAAAQGAPIALFDVQSGQLLRRTDTHAGSVKRLAWTHDGRLLFAGFAENGAVSAFGADGKLVFSDRMDADVYALAVAPDRIAAAALDGTLRVYSVANLQGRVEVRTLAKLRIARNPVSLAFAPDAKAIVVGYFMQGKAPDIVFWETGRVESLPLPGGLETEDLRSVAWSADGASVLAGGSFGFARRQVRLVHYDPARMAVSSQTTAARSSITDIVALPGDRFVFSAADASWGVATAVAGRSPLTAKLMRAPTLPDLDGAANLRVSDDGNRISWTLDGGSNRVVFDLRARTLAPGDGEKLNAPRLRRGLFDAAQDWEHRSAPLINGHRLTLPAGEISRAVTLFGGGPDAALGTSRALYRIAGDGRVVWRVATQTEVRAVNVMRDDRVLATAMLDGTVRLWRSADGAELLSVLALRDGRWVVWTPGGYFDASVGADRLVGWAVNQANDEGTAFFPVARLRERFHQPRYIDLLLDSLDSAKAARALDAEIAREATAAVPVPAAPMAPAPVALAAFPPLLASPLMSGPLSVQPSIPGGGAESAGAVEVPFLVSATGAMSTLKFEARADGRPARISLVAAPAAANGRSQGVVRVEIPAPASSIQLLARDANGYSEPLSFALAWPAPSAPVEPKPETPPAKSAEAPAPIPSATPVPVRPMGKQPRLFVLAIGVSEYQRSEYQLGLAAKDARDFAALFTTQQGRFYVDVTTRVLVDAQANRAAVLDALKWLAGAAGQGDVAMLFVAGHGLNGSSGKYYFLPYDARHEDLDRSAIAEDAIREALRNVPGRAVFFVDTCFAGNVLGPLRNRNREVSRFVNDLASAENGVVVFASSSGRQLSEEHEGLANGAFTSALLAGLKGKADLLHSGRVTYKGLDYFVSEEVRRITKGRQTPVSLAPWGVPDFALAAI